MNLKEALRLSSPQTAKKSNNRRDRSPLPPPSRRDYKRRPIGSPPPPYRDRRHSPPMRRSSSSYDGRRGGYGPPDRRYQEYKSEYITTQKRVYFNAHKEEEWLKDKYHLTNLLTVIEKRNEHARKVAKDFLLDLQSGNLDLSCSDSIE
ncbi:serrate RNA effector molecule-like isoform X2 [Raphanus sativus]|uniref:Serrate RNA effector molecule-like isoform X2 n=1 Tax=Raphanus sativus TaxID=3726 RepID=A0A9W3D9B0_RAPSA|nr:serrate RNA effector molecule-like isoform X2 [Raphanus sativus]